MRDHMLSTRNRSFNVEKQQQSVSHTSVLDPGPEGSASTGITFNIRPAIAGNTSSNMSRNNVLNLHISWLSNISNPTNSFGCIIIESIVKYCCQQKNEKITGAKYTHGKQNCLFSKFYFLVTQYLSKICSLFITKNYFLKVRFNPKK